MGNRANVLVRHNKADSGVYLYTHWSAPELPATLQAALARGLRWDDPPYLTRIIFDKMTERQQGNETGFGISAFEVDGNPRLLEVNVVEQTVSYGDREWSFDEYVALMPSEIEAVWD